VAVCDAYYDVSTAMPSRGVYVMTDTSSGTSHATRYDLRDRVAQNKVGYGGWCGLPTSLTVEIMGAAGCDWVCIDLQHGLIGDDMMRNMLLGASAYRIPALVRVSWNDPSTIMRALDAGADGVIVPMINTRKEAELAASASRYPPLGMRSWGPLRSTIADPTFRPQDGNHRALCLVMVETIESFSNLDEILDVSSVDGVFVGYHDFAISQRGTNENAGTLASDLDAIHHIAEECSSRNLLAGITCAHGQEAEQWTRAGYNLLAVSSDVGLFATALSTELAHARNGSGGESPGHHATL
jgi:4-hydroxy-2-oxoheptanedioate aldolase